MEGGRRPVGGRGRRSTCVVDRAAAGPRTGGSGRLLRFRIDQLLLSLKKAGLIESSRGRQGGYQLARSASHINLLQVVRALEGSIDSSDVFMREGSNQEPTRKILRDLWAEIFAHASEVLRTTTVDEVCERRKKLDPQIMYYI